MDASSASSPASKRRRTSTGRTISSTANENDADVKAAPSDDKPNIKSSVQHATGRGYTDTEINIMLPFWDGESRLEIATLQKCQNALLEAGYKKRDVFALKWYMKNSLRPRHQELAIKEPSLFPIRIPKMRRRSAGRPSLQAKYAESDIDEDEDEEDEDEDEPEEEERDGWHVDEHYDDPDATMELVSKDDVMFKVSGHTVAKSSTRLNKLFVAQKPASQSSGRSDTPTLVPVRVQLQYTSPVVSAYLDLVHVKQPVSRMSSTLETSPESLKQLLELAKYLDSEKVVRLTRSAIISRFNYIDLLLLASQYKDDQDFIRTALQSLREYIEWEDVQELREDRLHWSEQLKDDLDKLPEKYREHFMRQTFKAALSGAKLGRNGFLWMQDEDAVKEYVQAVAKK